jgi:uncharacterized protein
MTKYKKVFTTGRFQTNAPNSFELDNRSKSLSIGSRDDSQQVVYIGKVIEQGKSSNILDYSVLCDVGFPHVVGIFGSRGSGKSFDLGVFLEGIFGEGGASSDAAIVFDVQDQFWTLAYAPDENVESDKEQISNLQTWAIPGRQLENVKVWVPSGSDTQVPNAGVFSLAPTLLSLSDWLAVLRLEMYSPMGQALTSLLRLDGTRTPSELATNCNATVLGNFQQGTVDGLRWRLESFADTKVLGKVGLSIDDLIRPGSLNVILMRNLSDDVRALIVGVVSRLVADRLGRVQQARKVAVRTKMAPAAGDEKITRRLWMVLDEAHVLVPADEYTAATEPLIDYVKRGRDAGLSLIFATQQPSAVNKKLMSQADITITHMLGIEADIAAAIARMPTRSTIDYEVNSQKVSGVGDVIRSLGPGEAIVADGASGRIFVAKIRPRQSAHGGTTPK